MARDVKPYVPPSRYVYVDGVRTHYLESGDPENPTLVLLHSGEFGGCAELTWEFNFEALARTHHVLAPDYVGFGQSEKLRDFGSHGRRMKRHVTAFLDTMEIAEADFVGASVSGRFLCQVASGDVNEDWPIRRMVVISGGGFEPMNDERRILQEYDGTAESMKKVLEVLFHNSEWYEDEQYVSRRVALSRIPGAWEVAAASRFRAPWRDQAQLFGRPDKTSYENINRPVLFMAGQHDPLMPQNYWEELEDRTSDCEVAVFDESSHCPNIEEASKFNELVSNFLSPD